MCKDSSLLIVQTSFKIDSTFQLQAIVAKYFAIKHFSPIYFPSELEEPSISTILRMSLVKVSCLLLLQHRLLHSFIHFFYGTISGYDFVVFFYLFISIITTTDKIPFSEQEKPPPHTFTHTHVTNLMRWWMVWPREKKKRKESVEDCEQRKGKKTDTKSDLFLIQQISKKKNLFVVTTIKTTTASSTETFMNEIFTTNFSHS